MAIRTFGGVNARRKGALNRLENQLVSGIKIVYEPGLRGKKVEVPLTDTDKTRIEKEISTLKTRI